MATATTGGAAPVLVKWGGSLITDKTRSETVRSEVLERLAQELVEVLPELPGGVVLGHGSGSFGHVAAHRHDLRGPVQSLAQRAAVAAVQAAAGRLHRRVLEALLAAGARPFSLPASALMIAEAGRPVLVGGEILERCLALGLLPVTGGDVVIDRSWGAAVCSTEAVLGAIADHRSFNVRRALWLGETPGLLDAAGRTVPRVEAADLPTLRAALGAPRGTDVTGGMGLRLDAALALARRGIPSTLASGLEPGLLSRALRGEAVAGTEIPAQPAVAIGGGDGG